MPIFVLKNIDTGLGHLMKGTFAIVADGKCYYDLFCLSVKKKFHISKEDSIRINNQPDCLSELEALIEDVVLGNTILPGKRKKFSGISSRHQVFQLKTKKTMFRLYYFIDDVDKRNVIVLGHIKKDEKDQQKNLKLVKKIITQYDDFKASNQITII